MTFEDLTSRDIIKRDDFDKFVYEHHLTPTEALDLERTLPVEEIKLTDLDTEHLGKDKTSLNIYKNEISKISLLTPQEERDLAYIIQNSPDEFTRLQARNKLVEHNLRFGLWMAMRLSQKTSGSFGFEDLVQECNSGLITAANLFDGTEGVRFVSYAYRCIYASVSRAVADKAFSIRVPTAFPAFFNQLKQSKEQLSAIYGENVPVEEIVKECNRHHKTKITVKRAKEILAIFPTAISLDAPMYDDDLASYERRYIQLAEDEPLIEELIEDKFQKEYLDELMREVLKDRERQMLRERYGLDNGGMGLSYPQLAPRYNISASRAQQIVENAIHKLTNVIRHRGLIDTFRR